MRGGELRVGAVRVGAVEGRKEGSERGWEGEGRGKVMSRSGTGGRGDGKSSLNKVSRGMGSWGRGGG